MSTDLEMRRDPHCRQGGLWAYVSASRLKKWLACGLAFKFEYVDGLRTPTSPSLFLGRRVHAALEIYYRHRQMGRNLDAAGLSEHTKESWDQAAADEDVAFASVAEAEALKRQAAGLVSAYLAEVPPSEPRPLAVECAVEAPLVDPETDEDFGIPLVGVMDLVLAEPDGPIVADFKTSARSGEPLEILHEIQLSAYSYLFRQRWCRREGGLEIRSLVKTKVPKINFHRYPARNDTHFRRLFAVIREYLDALDNGRFNFRPGFACSMCDFRETHCRAWRG
jgi:putative RecB family exonuclease